MLFIGLMMIGSLQSLLTAYHFFVKMDLFGIFHRSKIKPWAVLGTFARKFSNIDFFLKILPVKDDELVMSEMSKNGVGGGGSPTSFSREHARKNT